MKVVRLGAIDIGSNAMRLLIDNVIEDGKKTLFKKGSLIRVPVRLGEDAFVKHEITEPTIERLLHAMHAFNHLMKANNVVYYMGCATSAMREASNGKEVIKRIKKETGIDIRIIDGKEEAEIIYSTQIESKLREGKSYLYVDVGGGSTEITLFANKKTIASHSFNIGTIRLLNNQVTEADWQFMKQWLKDLAADYPNCSLIGSGGNINKIFKLSNKEVGKALSFEYLKTYYRFLSSFTAEERVKELDLNIDRADVIIPASEIFINVMDWVGSRKVYVPKIGLSDGIIRTAYQNYKTQLANTN